MALVVKSYLFGKDCRQRRDYLHPRTKPKRARSISGLASKMAIEPWQILGERSDTNVFSSEKEAGYYVGSCLEQARIRGTKETALKGLKISKCLLTYEVVKFQKLKFDGLVKSRKTPSPSMGEGWGEGE